MHMPPAEHLSIIPLHSRKHRRACAHSHRHKPTPMPVDSIPISIICAHNIAHQCMGRAHCHLGSYMKNNMLLQHSRA